jgi:hypothetical protein
MQAGGTSVGRRVAGVRYSASTLKQKSQSHRVVMLQRQINSICAPHLASTAN